ncbi:mitochondrial carrier protein [Ditylenchus destructor]|nr:mitochondrial carrier protein [Ditylenchus destructor]
MGGLAGVITKTTVAPIDRVKLVLQLQAVPCNGAVASSSSCGVITVQAQQYGGIVDCFRKLCAEEGVKSLWRGNSATVVRTFPSNAMNLAFRDLYRSVFVNHVDRKKNPTRFALGNTLAGGAAGATALVFLYPLDFARTRLAVDSAKHSQGQRFNGIVHCFRTILLSEGGVHGLYKGFCASLQFTMISRAVFFGIFDTARAYLMDKSKTDQLSFMANWCLAQSAVITSSFMCYPLDTVRRRLMLESGKKVKMYRNSLDCWKKILKNESVPALYKGALSNSLRCTSGAMVLAVYYEMVKYI